MAKKRVRVAVSGAAGQIGYALIFRIASGQMFGPETEVELNLLEVEAALPSLNGVGMELTDCAFPLLKRIVCTADLKTAMDGINWAVLVGSVPRKAGMERSDLLQINGGIFTKQGQAINNYAASDVRTFVVGNPCNTNCLIAMHNAKDIPQDRFFAMTSLDENRARAQLALKASVGVDEVTDMIIWGNHSTTQYPDFYHAKIQGKPTLDVIKDESWLQNDFIPMIQTRGAEVIKARGASSAASAANAAVDGVYRIVHDTAPNNSFSVARVSNGEYGIEPGLIFSFPTKVVNGRIETVNGWTHNAFGEAKIKQTMDELLTELHTVRELGLIAKD